MKVIKSYITVDDILNRLTDEDLAQVKCAYFNKVEYDDGSIDFTMVINEDDGDYEEWELDDNWLDIYQYDEGMDDTDDTDDADHIDNIDDVELSDEYCEYLESNYEK